MEMRALTNQALAAEYGRAFAAWWRDQRDTDASEDLVFAENQIADRLGLDILEVQELDRADVKPIALA